ncbi:oxidoreductase [Brachybacterium sp. J153]|uniref:oxidoreductase n=1 Tax=Brachybacterium sp. J153 TaxID=3116488 RepID=UPI002E78BFBD|nr:oxidoreductase [Brachybacterium sp. J153]MEE1617874.1 oxidoreductase [Brachybacterium sp. J153]
MATFTADSLPDLTGRTAIVTGANTGLGKSTAHQLAAHGAKVILAVRDVRKGIFAASTMTGDVEVRRLDLADLASIEIFAGGVDRPVDLLINNAGLMTPPLGRTADGFELQLGTNHLGHFALTGRLLPRITGRVVTVSSIAHRSGAINLHDPNWERREYRRFPAYAQSKLANLLFTAELQRRLVAAGSEVLSMAAHPGLAGTDLLRRDRRGGIVSAVEQRLISWVGQDADAGALPTLRAAVDPDLPGDSFVGPTGRFGTRGEPGLVERSDRARDTEMARLLWEASEELTGVRFDLRAPAAAASA